MQHLYRSFLFILLFWSIGSTYAQIGGGSTFDFLDRTNSARVAAMGGNILAINDDDISLVLTNPSLIKAEMNNTLALDFVTLSSAYNYGDIMYSRSSVRSAILSELSSLSTTDHLPMLILQEILEVHSLPVNMR